MNLFSRLILATCLLFAEINFGVAFSPPYYTSSIGNRICTLLLATPLAKEGDWSAYLDEENTGFVYYFNKRTGESLWNAPTKTFPDVYLSPQQRVLAKSKQKEYKKSIAMAAESLPQPASIDSPPASVEPATSPTPAEAPAEALVTDSVKNGFFGSRRDNGKDSGDSSRTVEAGKVEPNWFDGLFDRKAEKSKSPAVKATDEPLAKEESGMNSYLKGTKIDVENEKAEVKPSFSMNGFFGGVTKKVDPVFEATDASEGPQTTPAPVAEPENEFTPQPKFGFNDLMAALTSKTEEATEKEKAQVTEKRQSKVITGPKVKVSKPKTENVVPEVTTVRIDMSAYVLPHPAKIRWGGEDAVFTKGRTFGVFDGVSGAEKQDGVPLYSTTLAKKMRNLVGEKALSTSDLTSLLTTAAEFADKSATGASTALIASISDDGNLCILNVGDSYCYVIRDGKIFTKTKEIVHYFECPYQLSEDSPDRPKDGTKLNIKVFSGDVILMGSDGVFDNLSDDLILQTVAAAPKRASMIARRIADLSRTISLSNDSVTPFAKLAKRNGFQGYESGLGGKLDDVSCVVVRCK